MSPVRFAWISIGLLAFAVGCAMCDNPYDQCGPLSGGACGDACHPGFRAGSILSAPLGPAYIGPPAEGEIIESESSGTPTPAPPKPAAPKISSSNDDLSKFFPGVPRESILSVTDRKVGEETDESEVEPEPQVHAPQQRPRTPAQPTSSGGWSARNPRVRRAQ